MKEREEEKEAVRTTIVGGRPPGGGRSIMAVPRGIEVLVRKAAVDDGFRQLLLTQRAGAAAAIGLELDPAEVVMLNSVPEEFLTRVIEQTVVPTEQRRVFLGKVAAAMLAALGVGVTVTEAEGQRGPGFAGAGGMIARPATRPSTQPAPTTGTSPPASTQPSTAPSTAPASQPTTRNFYGGGGGGGAGPSRR